MTDDLNDLIDNLMSVQVPFDVATSTGLGLPAAGLMWTRRRDVLYVPPHKPSMDFLLFSLPDFDFTPHSLPCAVFDVLSGGEPVSARFQTPEETLPGRVYPTADAARAAVADAEAYRASGPPDGFRLAAAAGDLVALGAAADWLRERGRPADPPGPDAWPGDDQRASWLDALRSDLEAQQANARRVRRLLDIHDQASPAAPPRRPSSAAVEQFLSGRGLVVHVVRLTAEYVRVVDGVPAPVPAVRSHSPAVALWSGVYRVDCYTDRREEATTRARLAALLQSAFPRGRFLVCFGLFPSSEESLRGMWEIGLD